MAKRLAEQATDQNTETKARGIDDVLGKDGVAFYPELPRMVWKQLVGEEIIIQDAKVIVGMKSKLGIHDVVLIKARLSSGGDMFTTITSGEVIVGKCKRLLDQNVMPVIATVIKGNYYNLVNE